MTVAGVAELKARLSEYLAGVRAGREVLVTDRGRPIARLVPVGDEQLEARQQKLERAGLLRRGAGISDAFLDAPRPRSREASLVDAVLEERREGR